MTLTYFDYAASAPLKPCAREALVSTLNLVGNPSSPHTAGRHLRAIVDGARQDIMQALGGKQLVFTSGGTEANALALTGLGDIPVLVSAIEHASVLNATAHSSLIPVTEEGLVNLDHLRDALATAETPGLLSVMLVSNEVGVIQPLHEIVALARRYGWKVHTDATQALGHIPLSFEALGVDMMTISSHKCGGPVGIGALILNENIHLLPLIRGGGQEFGMRSGTLSAPLALGFAAAIRDGVREQPALGARLLAFQQKIETALPKARVFGTHAPRTSNIIGLAMPGVPADLQLMAFDLKGIAVSAGAACSSGKMKESHVLAAIYSQHFEEPGRRPSGEPDERGDLRDQGRIPMASLPPRKRGTPDPRLRGDKTRKARSIGIPPEDARCAIRVSMGWNTQAEDVDLFIQAWHDIFNKQTVNPLKEAS